jgi:hypothetical protein
MGKAEERSGGAEEKEEGLCGSLDAPLVQVNMPSGCTYGSFAQNGQCQLKFTGESKHWEKVAKRGNGVGRAGTQTRGEGRESRDG